MDLQLTNQTAFVGGGTGALGRAICRTLALDGAAVTMLGRDHNRLRSGADEVTEAVRAVLPDAPSVEWAEVDLTSDDGAASSLQRAVSKHGVPHVLVCAGGSSERTDVSRLRAADVEAAMAAKLMPNVRLLLALGEQMRAVGRGRVVVVSGVGGVQPMRVHLPGGAANAALELFAIGYARVAAPDGVAVNVVNPGAVTSPRLQGHYAERAEVSGTSMEEARAALLAHLPAAREAEVSEVADVIAFLASPRSSFMVATSVNVDGGQVIGP